MCLISFSFKGVNTGFEETPWEKITVLFFKEFYDSDCLIKRGWFDNQTIWRDFSGVCQKMFQLNEEKHLFLTSVNQDLRALDQECLQICI